MSLEKERLLLLGLLGLLGLLLSVSQYHQLRTELQGQAGCLLTIIVDSVGGLGEKEVD
ncbi:unnamed protein product [Tetraodon nigroviridis]|uniref:(spotted green pufferfish) hypothetical protein n=1 Tax=Tetraodon nigroviridis TaxID=99883 RepID=Q4RCE3_TETNG|nr:unnamed protein product [Tetraodon nigroviridis]